MAKPAASPAGTFALGGLLALPIFLLIGPAFRFIAWVF